jgi:hypothetical protein
VSTVLLRGYIILIYIVGVHTVGTGGNRTLTNVLAVALLMRTVLNHVPPVFGHQTFGQVLANAGSSLKDSFDHLENGLRKIADFHTHRRIVAAESYPSAAQVEPFKPQFELLLQQVESRLKDI